MDITIPDRNIVVPGRGLVNLEAEAVNRAVQEEDSRLRFGWNEVNQDWIVYILMPRGFDAYYRIEDQPVYPVVGFGSTIPDPRDAIERLRAADGRRHGFKILNQLNKDNERVRQLGRDKQAESIGDTADRIEHMTRKDGLTEKYTKVFMN